MPLLKATLNGYDVVAHVLRPGDWELVPWRENLHDF